MQYEFKSDDAYRFAREQGAQNKPKGNELRFTYCPYCHGGQKKDKETFSISLVTGQFKCLRASCGVAGNFITLSRDFNFSLGDEFEKAYRNRNQYRSFKPAEKIIPKPAAVKYLEGRGISEEITKRYEITVQKDNKNILVFPFHDEKGVIRFIKYRKTDFQKGRDKNKEWCEPGCMPILFGMRQCEGVDRLIITEGQLDSLSVADAGIKNAVSVPTGAQGFTWVPHCWEWLIKFKELIVFGDCEDGKITLLEELKKRFPGVVKAVRVEDYKGLKDANEILQKHGRQSIIDAVERAEHVPLARVMSLADVEAVDLYSIPKIKTGITDLDRLIGGLYYGQLILLSGKRGEGKSTLMSQIIADALDQNQKVFAYSGELNDYYFKRWLDFQLAGPRNIIKRDREGETTYNLTNSTVDRLNDWYREKAFIYNNNIVEDDELEDLIKKIESVIMHYGVRLICIDNLMTALDVGLNEDLYRAQSRFVGKLAKITKRYEVVTILVAHPRKNMNGKGDPDDISGSADITNKVDVVMSYRKDEDLPEDARMLTVSKNRLTGKLAKGIRMKYDEASKRITGYSDPPDRAYGWERDESGFAAVPENYKIPF